MNSIEILELTKVQKLLNEALEGKIENRKAAEEAKETLDKLMEFKYIPTPQQAWKHGLE